MKFKNVAISGDIGTGKSTLARLLSEKLDWKYISAGNYFRDWYKAQGMDVSKVYGIPEEEDRKMEADFKKEMAEKSHVVFESRLAGWLAQDYPETLKVLCTVDEGEAFSNTTVKIDPIKFSKGDEIKLVVVRGPGSLSSDNNPRIISLREGDEVKIFASTHNARIFMDPLRCENCTILRDKRLR